MKCPHCGAENPDNGIFCQKCNGWILAKVYFKPEESAAPAPEPEAAKPVQKTNWKIIVPTVAALCALVLGIALVLPGKKPPEATTLPENLSTSVPPVSSTATQPPTTLSTRPPEVLTVFNTGLGHIEPFNNDSKIGFFCDGVYTITDLPYAFYIPENFSLNLDGRIGAYLTRDGQLLYLQDGFAKTVAENVLSYELCASGDALVFMGTDRKLYLYESNDLTVSFTASIAYSIGKDFAISPDGKTVAFLVPSSPGELSLHMYQDGLTTDLQVNYPDTAHIIAVSNGGSCVFMQTGLYLSVVSPDGGNIPLGVAGTTYTDETAVVYLNADHSQMLYHSILQSTYLVADTTMHLQTCALPLLPLIHEAQDAAITNRRTWTGYEDLRQQLYYSYMPAVSIWSLLADGTVVSLASNMKNVSATADARFAFMTDAEKTLWRMDLESKETVSIAENVSRFIPNFDGSKVYYVSHDMLYCCNGDGSGTAVSIIPVTEKIDLFVTRDSWLYYLDGSTLHIATPRGGHWIFLPEVQSCKIAGDGRLYACAKDGRIFVSEDGVGLTALYLAVLDTEADYPEFSDKYRPMQI